LQESLIMENVRVFHAARAGQTGDAAHEALSEVDGSARTAAGYARDVRAAAAGPAELASLDTASTENRPPAA
jgi:hypothetical protein